MDSQLVELSDALASATEQAAATVVAVHSEPRGSASGVVWRPGVIVTSEHALRRDEDIRVTLADGRVAQATLVGRDPSTDLAVLKCAEATAAIANAGDPTALKPGSLILAVGRTRASGPVAAFGVVSLVALERKTWTGVSLTPYVRLDVSIQPTAVGGAVVDAAGKIIGVITPRFGRFGSTLTPAATVNNVVNTLLEKGRIPRGYLGVGLQPVRLPEALRQMLKREERTAVIVLEIEPNSPANRAGLMIGDIIATLAGNIVSRLEDIHSKLHGSAIGKPFTIGFVRGGALQEAEITVAERPHGGE
ncbi:MAG TPA: trypsin-like peptidase domain-containing protein [Candidatus Sulfotelmatobacter sp.]|nr:trypsin-like peptidase domain-containing protein [Candidatus Sulfotelmatobacter sp.]